MRWIRLLGLLTLDVLTLVGSVYIALLIRFDGVVPAHYVERATTVLPLFVAGGLVIFASTGLYSGLWRYASIPEVIRITASSIVIGVWLLLSQLLIPSDGISLPRSTYLITAMLVAIGAGATRLSARFLRAPLARPSPGRRPARHARSSSAPATQAPYSCGSF